MSRVILVHGAGVVHGRSHLFNLKNYFNTSHYVGSPNVVIFKYGYVGLLIGQFMRTRHAALRLSRTLESGDVVIAHSHGNVVSDWAQDLSGRACHLIALSPALDSDHYFSEYWKTVTVFYNSGDNISWWADHIPFHPWGDMLATGIMDRSLRKNEKNIPIRDFMSTNYDYEHGKYLDEPNIQAFGPKLSAYIDQLTGC